MLSFRSFCLNVVSALTMLREGDAMNLGYTINYCSKLLRNNLNTELEKENLTISQFAVIKDIEINSLNDAPNSGVIAVEIAERLDMDKPTISGIVNRLSTKGYVKKSPNPQDQRSVILTLTKESRAVLPKLEEINKTVLAKATKDLTEEEIELLKRILDKMIKNLR